MTKWQGSVTHATEAEKAWARVRASLRESAGARLFEQWLKPIELIPGEDRDTIRLALPSAFMTNWVRNHYADRLVLEFKQILPNVRTVQIETRAPGRAPVVLAIETVPVPADVVASLAESIPESEPAPQPVQTSMKFGVDPSLKPAPAVVAAPAPVASGVPAERPPLDPRYTFARFVVDPSNKVAFNAAKVLAEPGPVRFSPLFLHSGTGQGKTHLMHAIGHAFLEHNPHAIVLCMSAERFMYDFVASMRARDTHAFKQRLRGADLLLIDDLQFIAGKDATQEEFFHTVNEIMAAGKRLVIAADRAPQALDGVEPRIVGRLASGLVADIRPSTPELRRAVLTRRLSDLPEVKVPDDVVGLLAARITSSIRELEGALTRVTAYAMLTGETIDLEFAQVTLGDMLRGARRRVTIDEIQKAVADHFELKPLDMLSARRARAVARPRQIAMYLAKRLTTRSLPEIGRKFGGRDHSTVIHAVRRIEELRDTDRDVDSAVRVLLGQLDG